MRRNKKTFLILFIVLLTGTINIIAQDWKNNENLTAQYFDAAQKDGDVAKLALFCSMMPKGGDIHHHYSGAMYAETYLDWAQSKKLKINKNTLFINSSDQPCTECITIEELKNDGILYRKVLNKWSDMDFSNHYHEQDQPDLHFFNTFSYFNVSSLYYNEGLKELKERAVKENVQYIETMLKSPSVPVTFSSDVKDRLIILGQERDSIALFELFNSLEKDIKASSQYSKAIKNYTDSLRSYHNSIDDSLFTMRFQTYVSRNSSPDAVFAKLYGCFDAVYKDTSFLIVGVNIVSPENGIVSMRDYWLHMQMFAYMKSKFQGVKTAMHAGELCMGMVKPEDLTYHVHDAIYTAKANRIGHGVDIPYETGALDILETMRKNDIAIEINLTSNEFILGVKGDDHPVQLYYEAGVPVVISTDDAGVSRNNLTDEYVKLVSRYPFSYSQVKEFVYNSIEYSFLAKEDKEKTKKMLDKKFAQFEALIAQYQTKQQGSGKK